MKKLLHVSASPRGAESFSRRFGSRLVSAIECSHAVETLERDLSATPLPCPGKDFMQASLKRQEERGAADIKALELSEWLIEEVETADIIVIDTPMHNYTVPAVLKVWIDDIVRPHRTFRGTPQGKIGLLANRPAFLVAACGGSVGSEGGQTDFLTPYIEICLSALPP